MTTIDIAARADALRLRYPLQYGDTGETDEQLVARAEADRLRTVYPGLFGDPPSSTPEERRRVLIELGIVSDTEDAP